MPRFEGCFATAHARKKLRTSDEAVIGMVLASDDGSIDIRFSVEGGKLLVMIWVTEKRTLVASEITHILFDGPIRSLCQSGKTLVEQMAFHQLETQYGDVA